MAGGSVLLALGLMEAGMRILGRGQMMEFEPNAAWGYLMKPSQTVRVYGHPIHINSWGLRGPEVPRRKQAGTIRILFVGDSVTYGGGRIEEDALFCRRVEASLRRRGMRAESINLSAPGWSPQNWIKYLERYGLYEADLVILTLPECDLDRPLTTMDDNHFRENAPLLRIHYLAIRLSLLWESRTHRPSKIPRDVSRDVAANTEAVMELARRCEQDHVRFLAVLVPSAHRTYQSDFWPSYESVLPCRLDLRGSLADAAFFIDGVHLNHKGHELVGDRILDTLQEMDLRP